MDELLDRLVANCGVERPVAEKAVVIVLDFLATEGPADKVQTLIDKLPGAAAAMQATPVEAGGLFGSMGGIMGAGTRMMSAGMSMPQVKSVTHEIIAFAREKVGEDVVGEIVGTVPGLSQFV